MNSKIKFPAQEWLGYDPERGNMHGYTFEQMEEFAELIIRGCARKANATALDLRNNPDLDGRKYVGNCILKCFGVDE